VLAVCVDVCCLNMECDKQPSHMLGFSYGCGCHVKLCVIFSKSVVAHALRKVLHGASQKLTLRSVKFVANIITSLHPIVSAQLLFGYVFVQLFTYL